jgi:hypothetical protein
MLLRSNRYIDFSEKEFNEYVSSDEEDDVELIKRASSQFDPE